MALLPSTKTLLIRAASAVVAVSVVAALFYFFQGNAIRILCVFAVLTGSRELVRVLFKPEDPRLIRYPFVAFVVGTFLVSSLFPYYAGLGFTLAAVASCGFYLVIGKYFGSLETLAQYQAKSLVGFFYLGLLPSFVFRLYYFENGMVWFLLLLSVVFSGDTFAYLFGVSFGRIKIMPSISPKKTVEGSLAGLVGSMVFSGLFGYFIPNVSTLTLVLMGLCVGIIAQLGDLFESMLKRVANTKDSGSLMPGHGGVLDRLDGILFAAPVVYFFADWFVRN